MRQSPVKLTKMNWRKTWFGGGIRLTFIAHTAPENGVPQSVQDHLVCVAKMAKEFASPLGFGDEAYVAGLLHDCGKYGDTFQRRLEGKAARVDHWSAGAYLAFKHGSAAASLAVHGHHLGLTELSRSFFERLTEFAEGRAAESSGRTLSGSLSDIRDRMKNEGLALPELSSPMVQGILPRGSSADVMLDIRMLYSCLVDADFLDTEAHFNQQKDGTKRYRSPAPHLLANERFELVRSRVESLQTSSRMSPSVSEMRKMVWEAAIVAATEDTRVRTLTAPTGSGKTLAMLGYALRHADHFKKKRIVVALPYLNIIEQTVGVYRDALADIDHSVVLEHHSLAERDALDAEGQARLASDNWDAPIVITTTVQLFESLFSNRPGRVRKLHRLADSVVLLDEVQTLPVSLIIPTVAALAALSARYRTTLVLATATQPAFDELNEEIGTVTRSGYHPKEMVSSVISLKPRLAAEFRDVATDWDSLAKELRTESSFLAIVNLKRHAVELAKKVEEVCGEPVYHLSTNMCSAHRGSVLSRIRAMLKNGVPCRVVATQCVEAGVDLDFPAVYRAWAPADSLAQAAGRCNRSGLAFGKFVVFQPESDGNAYPSHAYQQATEVTKALWREGGIDLESPDTFHAYWRRLYSVTRPAETHPAVVEAMCNVNFEAVAKKYRLIEGPTMQVVVPYQGERSGYDDLVERARAKGISREWIKDAQKLSVGVGLYKSNPAHPIYSCLEPVFGIRSPGRDEFSNWWIYTDAAHYSETYGLELSKEWRLLMA